MKSLFLIVTLSAILPLSASAAQIREDLFISYGDLENGENMQKYCPANCARMEAEVRADVRSRKYTDLTCEIRQIGSPWNTPHPKFTRGCVLTGLRKLPALR